ncbi:MAG: hypothetical protein PW788_10405 [Micavibrio sp.]|nr:hypothetical protein [Micavibrio sp.]
MTDDVTELAGPIEEDEDGKLVLKVPLFDGGDEFIHCTESISEIDGPYLKITLPDWLVQKLNLRDGSRVAIDNKDRKFNMTLLER